MPTTYNTVTITTSATKILSADARRKGFILDNRSSSTIFIGPDASITTSNAPTLLASEKHTNAGFDQSWRGDVYGIVASGTADVRYWTWSS